VGNTVAIHNILKKKTIKLNSQPAQYEKKKSTKTILEKNKKIIKKIMCRNTVAIHNDLKKKTTKLNSQPAQY
jgi:malate synthase